MINPIDSTAAQHEARHAPDWVQFLSNLNTPTTGELTEERIHQEIALQLHLRQLEQRQPLVVHTARMLVEFGANRARVVPSIISQLNARAGLSLVDDSWALALDIPQTPSGQRLLTMIQELCDLDDGLWPRWERETLFSVGGLRFQSGRVGFILTGNNAEAIVLLRAALDALA